MKWLFRLVYLPFLIIAPFILLIRLANYFYFNHIEHAWTSIALSAGCTAVLILLYALFMYSKITGRIGTWLIFKRLGVFAMIVVFGWLFYALMFISNENVKHTAVRKEFLKIHPILRLASSSLFFFDRESILVDASRKPDDYDKMGMKRNARSKHYIQPDGFTHAVDIRTIGRAEWRNRAMEFYFKLMGFQTLRHVGTADHLHVAVR